jgi:K+-transporting ATPase ATPase B chain
MSTTSVREPEGPSTPSVAQERTRVQAGGLDPALLVRSVPGAFAKLNPARLWRNPVMFIVEVGAAWTTILAIRGSSAFAWLIVAWLWLTVVFANLAEAVAEGRGKAQAETLRRAKRDAVARRLRGSHPEGKASEPTRSISRRSSRYPPRNCARATTASRA